MDARTNERGQTVPQAETRAQDSGSRPEAGVKRAGRLLTIEGTVPKPTNLPEGCHFAPRCPHVMPRCTEGDLPLYQLEGGISVRCVLYDLTAAVAADTQIIRMAEGGARGCED